MRKEVAFAIFAGIGAGLFLAFGVWKISSKGITPTSSPVPLVTETPTSKQTDTTNGELKTILLESPKNYHISVDSQVELKGRYQPDSWIVLMGSNSDQLVKTDSEGKFAGSINLAAGLNKLKITGIKEDQAATIDHNLVFSSEFSKFLDSSNTERAIAITGSITDINENNLQVKTDSGSIQLLSLSSDVSVVKSNNTGGSSEAKTTDLAIGDYIIAMGFNGSNNKVIEAKRIIIGNVTANLYEAVPGTVSTLNKKSLSITKKDGTNLDITLPKSWTGPDVSDLDENQDIIITGYKDDKDNFNLRSILTFEET